MQHLSDWYFSFVFFVAVLGLLMSGVLFFVNKTTSFAARLLAGFLASISIVALNNELMATPFFLRFPHFWKVVVAASFCVPAFGYLYVRSVLEKAKHLRKTDILFFVPAILHTLSLLPFYILPVEKKIEIISHIIANNRLIAQEPEGLLPAGWGIMARMVFGLITCTAQFILLARFKKTISVDKENAAQNRGTYRWLFSFSIVMSSLYIILLLVTAFQLTVYFSIWQTAIWSITATILFICISLLLRPSILYGIADWTKQQAQLLPVIAAGQIAVAFHRELPELKKTSLTIEKGKEFKESIENHFNANHPYLKGGYAMSDLSKELGIPSHQLSAFINQEYGKNFNELINEFRVDYLDTLLKSSPEYFQYTLETLGKLAGFNSRTAFITAVKKKTGLKPSEFFGKKAENIPA
jgi:AraC-like DNA-binding protein